MKRARHGVVLGLVLGLAYVVACGGEDPAGPGGVCSLASDCQSGLICITQKGKGSCSSDLAKVGGNPLPDGAADEGDGSATEGGATDSGTGEGGTTPPRDSGSDTGVRDSGPGDAAADG